MARVSVRNCCGTDEDGFDLFSSWSYSGQKEGVLFIIWTLCRVGSSCQLSLPSGDAPRVKSKGFLYVFQLKRLLGIQMKQLLIQILKMTLLAILL